MSQPLGQHWLKNREILDYISNTVGGVACPSDTLRAAQAKSSRSAEHTTPPTVLEIGPGLGTLTSSLLRVFDKVIAVEFDKKLAHNLPASFPGKNLEVVNGDILKFDFDSVPAPYVVAGNIPYYITSPIIERVLTAKNRPEKVVLLMQKEVAERIVSDKETVLSLKCKNLADVALGEVVKAVEFTPPPKVDSQVVIFVPHERVVGDEVFEIIKVAFEKPRKKAVNNLGRLVGETRVREIFRELGIDENARPGDLHLAEYNKIYQKMV